MSSVRLRVGALILAAVLIVIAVSLLLTGGGGTYTVRASFTDAGGLFDGSPVMVAGIQIGQVSRVSVGADGVPVVAMRISDVYRLRSTARADIRLLSNSGELNRVVEVTAGTGAPLPADSTIPSSHTASPVEIDQVLDVLSPSARANVREVLASLDGASHGLAGDYRASLKNSATAFGEAATVLRDVTQDGHSLRTLVRQGDVAMGAFAQNRQALGDTVSELSGLLTDTAQRERAIRASIAALPAGMRGPREVLDSLAAATPKLRGLLRTLGPALTALGRTSQVAVPALHTAQPLLSNVVAALRQAPSQLRPTRKLLAVTAPFAAQLAGASHLLLPSLDATLAYTPEAIGFLEDWSDVGSSYDAAGHAMRLFPSQAQIPNTTLSDNSTAPGYLAAPYVRSPGAIVGQPWTTYAVHPLSKRYPG